MPWREIRLQSKRGNRKLLDTDTETLRGTGEQRGQMYKRREMTDERPRTKDWRNIMENLRPLLLRVKLTVPNERLWHAVIFCLHVIFQKYHVLMYELSFITQRSDHGRKIACLYKYSRLAVPLGQNAGYWDVVWPLCKGKWNSQRHPVFLNRNGARKTQNRNWHLLLTRNKKTGQS